MGFCVVGGSLCESCLDLDLERRRAVGAEGLSR
jgi:hypothetical protein